MIYSIISGICIAAMLIILFYILIKFLLLKRPDKLIYLKNFKKGKCFIIYLIAVPLYYMAFRYDGKDIAASVFTAITKSVQLIVLKYEVSYALIKANAVFEAALYLCLALVVLNAGTFILSVWHQSIWNMCSLAAFKRSKKDKCIILGNNAGSKLVYKSCKYDRLIAGVMSKSDAEKSYIANVRYKAFVNEQRYVQWINKALASLRPNTYSNNVTVVINEDKEELNLKLCAEFISFMNGLDDASLKNIVNRLDVYVLGDVEFENIYSKYESLSKGCLHFVCKQRQVAIDFADKYPLTEFMDGRQIDFESSVIKDGAEINVAMIGFGATNRQVFMSMVANNQFVTKDEYGSNVCKPVNYHLFDAKHSPEQQNFNYEYFKYRYDFFDSGSVNKADYLPLADLPANEKYHGLNLDSIAFYGELKSALSFGEKSLNYIIVSLGDDYKNMDIANRISARLCEWGLKNRHLFVRIKDKNISEDFRDLYDGEFCHVFGCEADTMYSFDKIVREEFSEMSIMRNFIYDIEHDMKHGDVSDEEYKNSRLKWFIKRNDIERESNVYACLSLRSKLHTMGLDYCKKGANRQKGLSYGEFMEIYAKDDMPYIAEEDGCPVVRYSLDYKDSRRKTLAVSEHQRWNAYMIMKGFVPASKCDILSEMDVHGKFTNGKNYNAKRHGNLTTFDGLIAFRKMLAERDSCDESEYDVIKYDYQLLDGVWWLLDKNGYKIIYKGAK